LFIQEFGEDKFQKIEEFLGIEFAFEDGTWFSWDDVDSVDEDQPIRYDLWKHREETSLPEQYPCLVVYSFTDSFDRLGNYEIYMFEYVYLTDFQQVATN